MPDRIDRDRVDSIAELACLRLNDQEREALVRDLGVILMYMDRLGRVDTRGVEPVPCVVEGVNVLREDSLEESLPVEEGLADAPRWEDNAVIVPRFVES